jgi:hypothetical protein
MTHPVRAPYSLAHVIIGVGSGSRGGIREDYMKHQVPILVVAAFARAIGIDSTAASAAEKR